MNWDFMSFFGLNLAFVHILDLAGYIFYFMLKTKRLCHSERSEEPGLRYIIRFLASLGMTRLYGFQHETKLDNCFATPIVKVPFEQALPVRR